MAINIRYNNGATTVNAAGEIETPIDITYTDNKKPIVGEELEFFVDGKLVEKKKTATAGKVTFVAKCPAGTKTANLEVKDSKGTKPRKWRLDMTSVSSSTPPPEPTKAPTVPALDPKDPVHLMVYRSELAPGKYRLFARVLNYKGKGLKASVSFILNGKKTDIKTGSNGVCQFPENDAETIVVKPGGEESIVAFVDGIKNLTTTTIIRRKKLSPKDKAKAAENNRRTRQMFKYAGIAFVLWVIVSVLITSTSGLGEPLLTGWHEPTSQEKFFESVAKGTSFANDPAEENIGHWQKPAIFLPLGMIIIWTIFSFLYGIVAMREEVAEAWNSGMESLAQKHLVHAHDPNFERLLSWTGHLAQASVQPATARGMSASRSTDTDKKSGFWNYFGADVASEIMFNVMPDVIKAIVGR